MKKSLKQIIIFLVILTVTGCAMYQEEKVMEVSAIQDLAYDVNPTSGYTVYLFEDKQWTPYLVLTNDYGENTLLLRQYIMDEAVQFKDNEHEVDNMWTYGEFGAYYETSDIDRYINEEYFIKISEALQEEIVNSDIIITAKSCFEERIRRDLITISRKIFILSLEELDWTEMATAAKEGEPLKYFKDDYPRCYALIENGEKGMYWTRTPEIFETYFAFSMSKDKLGSVITDAHLGVRPAFCLPNELAVEKVNIPSEQEEVYILSIEKQYLE